MILLFLIEKFVSVRKKYKQSSSSKLDTKQDKINDEGIKAEEIPLIMKRSFEKLEEEEVEIKQQKYDVIVVGLIYALCSVIRALLNLSSSKYTKPYNVSMIQNAFSFLTPLVDTIFLKTRLPKSLFPAIVMSICCCCLALYAQHKQQQQLQIIEHSSYDNNNDDNVFTIQDLMGCLLQVLSMFFRTITDIMMKTTTDVMSGYQLIQIGNLGLVILPLIISFLPPPSSSTTTHTHHNNTTKIIQDTRSRVSHNGWTVFAHLSIKSFLCWLAITTLCSTIAFSMKVYLTRERSPGFYSSFAGIVTISSICFSALILDEPIGGGIVSNNNKKDNQDNDMYYYCRLEWLGILGTILITTVYIMSISPQPVHQHRG